GRCEQVFITGISMGACLAFRLAETQGAMVSGLVVVNPSLAPDTRLFVLAPILKHVNVSVKGIAGDIKKPGASEGGYQRVPLKAAGTLPELWKLTGRRLAGGSRTVRNHRSTVGH